MSSKRRSLGSKDQPKGAAGLTVPIRDGMANGTSHYTTKAVILVRENSAGNL